MTAIIKLYSEFVIAVLFFAICDCDRITKKIKVYSTGNMTVSMSNFQSEGTD